MVDSVDLTGASCDGGDSLLSLSALFGTGFPDSSTLRRPRDWVAKGALTFARLTSCERGATEPFLVGHPTWRSPRAARLGLRGMRPRDVDVLLQHAR